MMRLHIEIDLNNLPEGAGASSLHLALYAPLLRICNKERTSMDVEVGGVRVGSANVMPMVQEMVVDQVRSR